jgi:hypothetical protein
VCEQDATPRDRISADLQSRGVPAAVADLLAAQVEREVDGSEWDDAILDGAALGFRAQHAVSEELAKSAVDLQEIQRLMSSFAGELSKLDEVLEVLAAYLRRMRTAVPASRVLQ